MPIDRLVAKCKGYGLNSNQTKLIESYLKGREYIFSVNGHLSKRCKLSSGVPQGSVLGPLLWLIFINDLAESMTKIDTSFLFADDVAILNTAESDKKLKTISYNSLQRVTRWSRLNNCIISIKKTKIMWLGKKDLGKLQIDKQPIESVTHFKYLGHVLDRSMNGKKHVEYLEGKTGPMLSIAYGLSKTLSLEKLSQLIHTYIYPVAMYGLKDIFPILGKVYKTRWEALITKLQKSAVNAPSNAKLKLIDETSRIPSLSSSIKRRLIDQSVPIIMGKSNSFLDKLDLQPPQKARRKGFYLAKETTVRSPVTAVAKVINEAKITKANVGTLYNDYKPKLSSQIINSKFTPKNRELIKNLAIGSLTRDIMSKCDDRIYHYCISCSRNTNKKYKMRETIQHFLNCHSSGTYLDKTALTVVCLMDAVIKDKLSNDIKLSRSLNQCLKYKSKIIHSEKVDAMLGIGKVQVFKPIATKKQWIDIESYIFNMQEHILKILEDKHRLGNTYFDRVEDLIKEQD